MRLSLLLLTLVLLAGCGTKSAAPSTPTAQALPTQPAPATITVTGGSVAATVNGHPIPMSQYRLLVNLGARQYAGQRGATPAAIANQMMKQVIIDEVVRQYAVAHHISVSPQDISTEVASQERQAGGTAKFAAELKHAGLTMAEYRDVLVAPNLLTRKVANKLFPIKMTLMPVAHVRHILIALKPQGKPARTSAQARALALTVLAKVRHGGTFAALARQYSDDPGSAVHGGDLGNINRGQTVPPFDRASFTAPLNTPTLVHSTYGYHILEVLSRTKTRQPATGQAQAQQQKFGVWANNQLKKARVKRLAQVK